MLYFIIIAILLVITGLLFGKADTKKEILNQVGLDLSESNYKEKKQKEFSKYCIKAMRIASSNCLATSEYDFLQNMISYLNPLYSHTPYIGVKMIYVDFAVTVMRRRMEAINKGKLNDIPNIYDFSNKTSINSYIDILWKEYQNPWPTNWLQKDGIQI